MQNKQINHIMSRKIISLPSATTLSDASRTMAEASISCLLIIDNGALCGILTEQDIVHALCCNSASKDEPVSKFMNHPVLVANQQMDIYQAFDFIRKKHIRHLVVVDEEENVSGIVTLTDLAKATDSADFLEFKKVSQIMTPNPHTISPDDTIMHAVQLMDKHTISCIIITEHGEARGILTERDVAALVYQPDFDATSPVSTFMTSPVLTVQQDIMALEASSMMRQHRLRRLVVVDEGGSVSGILTQYDIIKGLTGRYIEQLRKALDEKENQLMTAKEQLASRELMDYVLNETPVAHYAYTVHDGRLNPQFATPNIVKLLGYPADDFVRSEQWWEERLHPDERNSVIERRNMIIQSDLLKDCVEYRFRHAEGHYIWLQERMVISRHDDGSVAGISGSWIDQTDQFEQLDELNKLRQAVEHAGEAIVITDASGMIEYVNPAYVSISGFSTTECIGKQLPYFDAATPHRNQYRELMESLARGNCWSGTLIDHHKSGKIYPVLASIAPIFDSQHRITHFVSIQQDMTEHDELEKKFYQAQKMEALGTLVGGIAHDFNNLLSSMLGNLYLIRQRMDDNQELAKRIRQVEKSGYDAAEMIKKMLTFARKGKVEMITLPLSPFIKEVYKLSRLSTPENILMNLDLNAHNIYVKADATQLQQVLLNLLTNARHAVESTATPCIQITLQDLSNNAAFQHDHPELSGQSYARLSISDNGYGIAESHIDHIFEPFFTTKEAGKGTGLGLAMAFGAVQSHGGLIEVESREGSGTTFHIYLPMIAKEAVEERDENQETYARNRETILIVDDEAGIRSITDEILKHLGYHVIHASNGQECIEIYQQFASEIDIIVTDVIMPKMNGADAIRTIRRSNPDIPVIFMTGYDHQNLSEIESFEHSAIIRKPASIPELSRLIGTLLERAAR